jgi:hypothetical protein
MKNNLLLLVAGLITYNVLAISMRPGQQDAIRALFKPGEVDSSMYQDYQPAAKQKTAQEAFDKVLPKLRDYEAKTTPAERDNFVKYLEYYKSWYQSVTPAPVEITNKLTPNDRAAEYAIKYEAQDFVTEPVQTEEKPRMGASKLSRAGEDYYLMVINHFAPSTRSTKPGSKLPAPQKKPARRFQRVL